MGRGLAMRSEVESVDGEIQDIFRALRNGFHKLDKIRDANRQLEELEKLTGKMKECKRLIREFDNAIEDEESRNPLEVNSQLIEKKQLMIRELNSYVSLRKTYKINLGNKREKRTQLFDMGGGGSDYDAGYNFQTPSEMSNQEFIDDGRKRVDEIDQAIEHSKTVVEQTIEVGGQTAATLKGQTGHLGRIDNEMDAAQFSIKKASQAAKELGHKVAADKCFILILFMIICGGIVIMLVKVVNPHNESAGDAPGLAPPPLPARRLL